GFEYLGRTDSQVKIRGYRIEPQEVEAVLAAEPEVANCAVVPWGDGNTRRLVAYYSVRKGRISRVAALRRSLAGQLPGYMIPSQFVEMAELPLTRNGKVDRGALPEPSWEDRLAARETGARHEPETEQEAALAGIARTLLN